MLSDLAKKLKVVGAMLATAGALAFASPAQAAAIQGEWDPALPSPFALYGWRGTVLLDIPDSCLVGTGTVTSCAGMTIKSSTVEFYLLANGPNSASTDTIKWDTPDGKITSFEKVGGVLTALYGSFNYWVHPDAGGTSLAAPYWFTLAFQGPQDNSGIINNYAFLMWCLQLEYDDGCVECERGKGNSGKPTAPSTGSFLTFTVLNVPEPGSLALMLPALGMLAVFRRRKSAAA